MPSFNETSIYIDIRCEANTDKAILITFDGSAYQGAAGGKFQMWVPQSQIDDDSEVWKKGDTGRLVVNEWFGTKIDERIVEFRKREFNKKLKQPTLPGLEAEPAKKVLGTPRKAVAERKRKPKRFGR